MIEEDVQIGDVRLIRGDCLQVMPLLNAGSVDMVFADLPYSTKDSHCTNHRWDRIVDLPLFFAHVWRLANQDAMCCMTANDRLAAHVAVSAKNKFRYTLIWQKSIATLYFQANKRPLLAHEYIQVLGSTKGTYNPQKTAALPYRTRGAGAHKSMRSESARMATLNNGDRFPRSVLSFGLDRNRLHPTQKPVALLEWLISTYTHQSDMVLDPTAGSGTTAIAALKTGRKAICIEQDKGYFDIMVKRVRQHHAEMIANQKKASDAK